MHQSLTNIYTDDVNKCVVEMVKQKLNIIAILELRKTDISLEPLHRSRSMNLEQVLP